MRMRVAVKKTKTKKGRVSKASDKTLREIRCRTRSPEAEEHYKAYNREYMRAYRKRMAAAKKKAAKK